jgi:hypothetical protein
MTDNDPSVPEPNDADNVNGPEPDTETNSNEKAYWSENIRCSGH